MKQKEGKASGKLWKGTLTPLEGQNKLRSGLVIVEGPDVLKNIANAMLAGLDAIRVASVKAARIINFN